MPSVSSVESAHLLGVVITDIHGHWLFYTKRHGFCSKRCVSVVVKDGLGWPLKCQPGDGFLALATEKNWRAAVDTSVTGHYHTPSLSDSFHTNPCGQVAQLVEQRTENPCVGGSIPSLATIK